MRRRAERAGRNVSRSSARQVSVCTRCDLALTRTNTVFGTGDPHSPLMLVGEGPGENEDATGLPFVGRAGKLLDDILVGGGP